MELTGNSRAATKGALTYALDHTPDTDLYYGVNVPTMPAIAKRYIGSLIAGQTVNQRPPNGAMIPRASKYS